MPGFWSVQPGEESQTATPFVVGALAVDFDADLAAAADEGKRFDLEPRRLSRRMALDPDDIQRRAQLRGPGRTTPHKPGANAAAWCRPRSASGCPIDLRMGRIAERDRGKVTV